MVNPRALKIFRDHHDILLLGCIYNSNRFKISLLNIVEVSEMSTTIQVALVFMKSEKETDYLWALTTLCEGLGEDSLSEVMLTDRQLAIINAKDKLFPTTSLFPFRWHLQKNVVKVSKKNFPTEKACIEFYSDWESLLNSIDICVYEVGLSKFERKLTAIPVNYCISTWLENWKEKVVQAWVDQRPHFNNTITSKVEGCHSKIKEYLDSSTEDLKCVYESLELY